jgi:LSD1 subclass zinc finger protein
MRALLEKKKLPRGSHPLRCPACQSTTVHLAPPEGEYVVIVCLSCYKRWAISVAPDSPEPPDVA